MALKDELGLREGFTQIDHEALLNIYYTATCIRKRAAEFFRPFGLTDVQFNLMMLLKHQADEQGGLTQIALSRMMLVNRANITALVDRMEKNGFVERHPVPDDRRCNIIRLTKRGQAMLARVETRYTDEVRAIMGALNTTEKAEVMGILEKIRRRIQKGSRG